MTINLLERCEGVRYCRKCHIYVWHQGQATPLLRRNIRVSLFYKYTRYFETISINPSNITLYLYKYKESPYWVMGSHHAVGFLTLSTLV